jgi:peptidyl-prolyl cis-trans isomerase B (cyclophilin B)
MRKILLILTLILTSTLSFSMENKKADTQTKVKLSTSMGTIVVQVKGKSAPISSENFLTYVKEGFYDGTIFHRIIPSFMAQGGGFDGDLKQKEVHDSIKNEADNGLKNTRGTLAMARTPDPDSATAQFFINYKDNAFLDYTSSTAQGWGYAVFAEVVEGMDVVDKMEKVATGNTGGHQDVPKENIVIEKAEIIK